MYKFIQRSPPRRRRRLRLLVVVFTVGSVADVHTDSEPESDVAESREGPESPDPSC